ncbi:VOC family protein [Mesorhizobium sp. M1182]|uniref:VOC family protein n=1 Tax=unclassified Mesorhizobium TaxID=325217 RepID=UPI00333589D9
MSSLPSLAFVTWFSADPRSAAAFYANFGIAFRQEQHGSGPIHFAFQGEGLAIELYPAEATTPEGAGTMIGFEVANADEAASAAKANGFGIIADVKATAMGRRVIVRDPDGRQVFLFSTT